MVCCTTPSAVVLSTWIGVGGCGCPILISMCHIGTASQALMYSAPSSASAADDITAFMIYDTASTTPLLAGNSSSLVQKK